MRYNFRLSTNGFLITKIKKLFDFYKTFSQKLQELMKMIVKMKGLDPSSTACLPVSLNSCTQIRGLTPSLLCINLYVLHSAYRDDL